METLRRRIETWRRSSGGAGRRIPEALWAEAAEVASMTSVEDTARVLSLDRRRLERRVAARASKSSPAEFIELSGVEVGGARMPAAIEFVDTDGARVRVEMRGRHEGLVDVVELARAFWSRRR